MIQRTLVLVVFILMLASAVSAQTVSSRGENWEFSFQTRYTMEEDYTGEGGSTLNLKSDLGWGMGFNYNINRHFNVGMIFGWRSVPYEATAVDASDPAETNRFGGEMTTSNIGMSVDYNILKGPFTPYVTGSLSWMHVNSNILAGWTGGCWWYPWWGYVCGPVPLTYGDNSAAYTLGLGARLEVSSRTFLRVGYERGWIDSSTMDGTNMVRIDIGFMY
ncbi:hypothetical protein DRQ50_13200 [bacterium]|nr:MAG: hypothetical protein DRQ50_13200 [bacterium]